MRYYPGTDIIPIAEELDVLTKKEIEEINEGIPTRAAVSGGSRINSDFQKYQTILALLPFLRRKTIQKFVSSPKKSMIPNIAKFGHVFTRAFDLRNKNDIGGRRYISRLKYFIYKKLLYGGG